MDKIKSRVVQGRVMPGGWHFPVENNKTLDAPTFEDLIKVVENYRMENLLPLGDPLLDVENYICGKFPHFCHKVRGASVSVEVRVGSQGPTLLDRVVDWMKRMMVNVSMDTIVLQNESMRRAEICIKCPMNTPMGSACGPCISNVNRLSMILRMGKTLPREKRLKACRHFGHDNKAAVWQRDDRLTKNPEAPANCWLRG